MAALQILPISLLDPVRAFVTAVPVVCTIAREGSLLSYYLYGKGMTFPLPQSRAPEMLPLSL